MSSMSRASIFSARLRKEQHPTWTFRVTQENYPALFECFETISHDSGGGAGHPYHCIDPRWEPHLPDFEVAVAALSKEDRETFCIGDRDEGDVIRATSSVLGALDGLLEEWFDA